MPKKVTAAPPHPLREGMLSSLVLTAYPSPGTPRGWSWAPFSCLFPSLSKTLEKKGSPYPLKSLPCTMEKNTKKLSCSLKPYTCKCTHLNHCQCICPIKLVFQSLACVGTVVPLPGSGLHRHMKEERLASLLDPCLFRTERSNWGFIFWGINYLLDGWAGQLFLSFLS